MRLSILRAILLFCATSSVSTSRAQRRRTGRSALKQKHTYICIRNHEALLVVGALGRELVAGLRIFNHIDGLLFRGCHVWFWDVLVLSLLAMTCRS